MIQGYLVCRVGHMYCSKSIMLKAMKLRLNKHRRDTHGCNHATVHSATFSAHNQSSEQLGNAKKKQGEPNAQMAGIAQYGTGVVKLQDPHSHPTKRTRRGPSAP